MEDSSDKNLSKYSTNSQKHKMTFKIQVYCNFTTGATEVLHDTEILTEVEHCHDPGEAIPLDSIISWLLFLL